jgi:hypothetical protein
MLSTALTMKESGGSLATVPAADERCIARIVTVALMIRPVLRVRVSNIALCGSLFARFQSKRVAPGGNFARKRLPTARLAACGLRENHGRSRPRASLQAGRPNFTPSWLAALRLGRRLAHVTGRVAIPGLKARPSVPRLVPSSGGEGSGSGRARGAS